ncbi:MAG: HNH endonuclease [Parcubacteria group bacterium Athens0714_16]|nr:MAG: HNH endonuclease [Parcubacteria group bacterium Athens0714_16]
MKKGICSNCGVNLINRWQLKYCSNKCQFVAQYKKYIKEWKLGNKNGNVGIHTRNVSKHLKRYLSEKYGEHCSQCGWNKKHPKSKKVPIEIDHIDGNSENNLESNLRLLCPNCHSLTPNFKNLNHASKGRQWRNKKYIKNQ